MRKTLTELIKMKKQIIEDCINKRMKWKEGARILVMHPKALSRLKKNYLIHGECVLAGRKPGPKKGSPDNKTPDSIEEIVEEIASDLSLGPVRIAEILLEKHGIKIHQTTVWRILKRRKSRYTTEYKRWKQEPKLYCLEEPGIELQLDGCYPYGRGRKIVGFDAIDDCSRWVLGKVYEGQETLETACAFIDELVKKAPFMIRRIRVDNKLAKGLRKYCERMGIEIHANDAYSPEQNGKIERFHKTLKREFFWKFCSFEDSVEEINYKYTFWQSNYNYHRKHGGYGMNGLSPVKKLNQVWQNQAVAQNSKKVTGFLQQYIFLQYLSGLLECRRDRRTLKYNQC